MSRFPGYFPTLFGAEFASAGLAALFAAQPPQFHGCRISLVLLAVLNLAGRDVADELAQRNRVARALLSSLSHASIIAQAERNPIKSAGLQTDPRTPADARALVPLCREAGYLMRSPKAREAEAIDASASRLTGSSGLKTAIIRAAA